MKNAKHVIYHFDLVTENVTSGNSNFGLHTSGSYFLFEGVKGHTKDIFLMQFIKNKTLVTQIPKLMITCKKTVDILFGSTFGM